MLLVDPQHRDRLQEVIRYYSLREDGDEKGAKENRCDFKIIDPEKGSATGYIAKYISKNIDGEGLDEGVYGDDPKTSAQRVDAWASCWSIRQFQQIGGCSVSVWREMRRLKQQFEADSLIEKLRSAADNSNWCDFVELMGGATVKRNKQPIRTAYEDKVDTATGEVKVSYFDRTVIKAVKGIRYLGKLLVTRDWTWIPQPAGFAL